MRKAFGHAVMEVTMTQSIDGRGPTDSGVAIIFIIVVTL